ncbi:hypothetical protein V7128_07420 [Neobacillus vireti]|uniref:hypothetical protein n=1 Tax=Neobacillus vireti TaxID=220686 RepID=UPI002FFEEA61
MENKQVVKAQKIVTNAVNVFSTAVAEVEKAQAILSDAIKKDSMEITSLKNRISKLEADKQAKGEQMKKNAELLTKLKEFSK